MTNGVPSLIQWPVINNSAWSGWEIVVGRAVHYHLSYGDTFHQGLASRLEVNIKREAHHRRRFKHEAFTGDTVGDTAYQKLAEFFVPVFRGSSRRILLRDEPTGK